MIAVLILCVPVSYRLLFLIKPLKHQTSKGAVCENGDDCFSDALSTANTVYVTRSVSKSERFDWLPTW